jgi:hypothetical protein
MSDFVEDFLEKCIDKGITKPADIASEALKQRDLIDVQLKDFQKIRELRDNLTKVIRSLNPELKEKKKAVISIYPDLVDDNLTDSAKNIANAICDYMNPLDSSATSRDIIGGIGWGAEEPTPVYMSIRYLLEKGILLRNADRSFTKGPNWENRNILIQDN